MALIYTPTMHLRWLDTECVGEEEGPCAVNIQYWPEVGQSAYVLHQWWQSSNSGEWRPIELGYNREPPEGV